MRRLRPGRVGSDPPQQVGAGPDRFAPQRVRKETPVGKHQHSRGQPLHQRLGQGRLGLGVGTDLRSEHRVRAALGQRHDPRLRKGRPLALVHPRPAEVLRVRGRVRDIQATPVDRHQSQDVLRFAQRRVHPSHAEDVVAEAFLVAWRRLDDAPPRSADLRAWLFGITRNHLLNARRGQDRRDVGGAHRGGGRPHLEPALQRGPCSSPSRPRCGVATA